MNARAVSRVGIRGAWAVRDGSNQKKPDDPATRPAPPYRDADGAATDEFAATLLRALVDMAGRSKRRQADLTAALRGAGMPADPARVRGALRRLQQQRCIENLVPLSDGGLLLSVTTAAIERLGGASEWLPLGAED